MRYFKFSVITPTIGRDSIERTIKSIDEQNYPYVEHIIMYDGGEDETFYKLKDKYASAKRLVYHVNKKIGDFGNSLRAMGGDLANGDYITYIDDDDRYINNTFSKLNEFLNTFRITSVTDNYKLTHLPTLVIFPCWRFNNVFYNLPPADCMTVSCQYIHKNWADDKYSKPIRFARDSEGKEYTGYTADSIWIGDVVKEYGYTPFVQNDDTLIKEDCLTEVNVISSGK